MSGEGSSRAITRVQADESYGASCYRALRPSLTAGVRRSVSDGFGRFQSARRGYGTGELIPLTRSEQPADVQLTLNDRSGDLTIYRWLLVAHAQSLSRENRRPHCRKVSGWDFWVRCIWMSCELQLCSVVISTDQSKQRLEDEYSSNVIITAPTVPYKGKLGACYTSYTAHASHLCQREGGVYLKSHRVP